MPVITFALMPVRFFIVLCVIHNVFLIIRMPVTMLALMRVLYIVVILVLVIDIVLLIIRMLVNMIALMLVLFIFHSYACYYYCRSNY